MPSCFCSSVISRSSESWTMTSSAVVGSSAMMRSGGEASALAGTRRWRIPPPAVTDFGLGHGGQVDPVQIHVSGLDLRVFREQFQDGGSNGGLSAPGFADQAHRGALVQGEGNIVHRGHLPGPGGVVHGQVLDTKKRFRHRMLLGTG